MPAKKKSSRVHKRTAAKVKKRVAATSKERVASPGTTRAKKSATRTPTKGRKNQITATRSKTTLTPDATSSIPEPKIASRSAQMVAEVALQVFTGVVRITGNQSILNGTLLIRAGVADFPSAVGAATQYLRNQGIQDGDNISVTGERSSVQNGGQSINVIVMSSAQKS